MVQVELKPGLGMVVMAVRQVPNVVQSVTLSSLSLSKQDVQSASGSIFPQRHLSRPRNGTLLPDLRPRLLFPRVDSAASISSITTNSTTATTARKRLTLLNAFMAHGFCGVCVCTGESGCCRASKQQQERKTGRHCSDEKKQ